MRIKSVHVCNFRSVLAATMECDALTALVGANGAGKSNFLKAIELFYAISPKLSVEDFYDRRTNAPIEITLTFNELDADELERFSAYLQNQELSVVRVLTLAENKYHGSALQNPAFREVRMAQAATDLRRAYNALRDNGYEDELPPYTNQDAARIALKQWESDHPGRCARERDDGQFFGFKQVGQGYLGKDTRFVFIPAVRDASEDAEEGRGSAISELMDLVVRKTLFEREEIKAFKAEVERRYAELLDPARIDELLSIE